MTATATATRETPLDREALNQVFASLRAIATNPPSNGAHCADLSNGTSARLRQRLAEYAAQGHMADLVLLLRRYFNTYRVNGWRLVEWQAAAALRLLATVADANERDY